MAITNIYPIYRTIIPSIRYAMNNKVQGAFNKYIDYRILFSESEENKTTYYTLTTVNNCGNALNPEHDFLYYINRYGLSEIKNGNAETKNGFPIVGWHLLQSFDDVYDPLMINEIGQKIVKEIFPEFASIVSTHTNTQRTHNHIIICAWNMNGKKWHNCHESYQRIRTYSDKLCDIYGLPVCEKTREQKLIKRKDSKGKIRYYEPTDRKNNLIKLRKEGELYPDDVGSYRNTFSYDMAEIQREIDINYTKEAIDNALPYAVSYEHLLELLKMEGIEIKSHKKDGEYRKYVTFFHPFAENPVRDDAIDKETNFYLRKNLEKVIEKQNGDPNRKQPYMAELQYGYINVQCLNEDNKSGREERFEFCSVPRNEFEKALIVDIKTNDEIINNVVISEPEKQEIIHQIQESLDSLHYIERTGYYSAAQIEDRKKELENQLPLGNKKEEVLFEIEDCQKCLRVLERLHSEELEREKRLKRLREKEASEMEAKEQQRSEKQKDGDLFNKEPRDCYTMSMEDWQREISAKRAEEIPKSSRPKKRHDRER